MQTYILAQTATAICVAFPECDFIENYDLYFLLEIFSGQIFYFPLSLGYLAKTKNIVSSGLTKSLHQMCEKKCFIVAVSKPEQVLLLAKCLIHMAAAVLCI